MKEEKWSSKKKRKSDGGGEGAMMARQTEIRRRQNFVCTEKVNR
jgi:hypothetical protein